MKSLLVLLSIILCEWILSTNSWSRGFANKDSSLTLSSSNPAAVENLLRAEISKLNTEIDTLRKQNLIIRTSNKTDSSKYVFSVGSNFDFFNGIKASNIYFDVKFVLPRLWKDLGIEASVYQDRTSLGRRESQFVQYNYHSINSRDSVNLISAIVSRAGDKSRDRLGFSIALTKYEFTHFSWIAYVDLRRFSYSTANTDKTVFADSTKISMRQLDSLEMANNPLKPESNTEQFEALCGLGGDFRYSDNGISLNLKIKIGGKIDYATQKLIGILEVPFVFIQDPGLKLGGAIKLESRGGPSEFLFYLAKEFSLNKLTEYLK